MVAVQVSVCIASIQALSRMSGYGRMRRKTEEAPGPRLVYVCMQSGVAHTLLYMYMYMYVASCYVHTGNFLTSVSTLAHVIASFMCL